MLASEYLHVKLVDTHALDTEVRRHLNEVSQLILLWDRLASFAEVVDLEHHLCVELDLTQIGIMIEPRIGFTTSVWCSIGSVYEA
jgi:hypothetical protein